MPSSAFEVFSKFGFLALLFVEAVNHGRTFILFLD
jgi:hypothetical protein